MDKAKTGRILLLTAALLGMFYAGMRAQAFLYEDLCRDIGGSVRPGNPPLCVTASFAP
ncbi:hypothetical protein ACG2K1_10170 [Neisseria sp. 23W00296]|jgi:periplasmic protein|uniref:hypothetical protein n=1 Tax=unclassified Neisseria TaxID=2623750 RepID=UPI00375728D4